MSDIITQGLGSGDEITQGLGGSGSSGSGGGGGGGMSDIMTQGLGGNGQITQGYGGGSSSSSSGSTTVSYPTWLQLPTRAQSAGTTSYKVGDTAPSRCAYMTDADGRPIDLTGATVTYRLSIGGSLVVNAAATVLAAMAGMVGYNWNTGDLAVVGTYEEEWEVVDATGKIMHVPSDGYAFLVVSPALG